MLKLQKTMAMTALLGASWLAHASQGHHHDHAGHDHSGHSHVEEKEVTVATVNGVTISNYDLMDEVKRMSRGQQAPGMAVPYEQKKQILDYMVGRILLLEAGKAQKIVVADQEVAAEFSKIEKRFPDAKTFESTLKQDGLTPVELKKQIGEGMLIQKVMDANLSVAEVSKEDVQAFYDGNPQYFKQPEQVKASHILLKVKEDGSDKEAVTAKLLDLKKKAEAGEDFSKLAEVNSEGPSASRGGDLGFFGRGQMVPAFEQSAFTLKAGAVSDVIETQFGLHILKVFEKKAGGVTPLSEAREKIMSHLSGQKKGKAAADYVDQLKAKAKIDITLTKA